MGLVPDKLLTRLQKQKSLEKEAASLKPLGVPTTTTGQY